MKSLKKLLVFWFNTIWNQIHFWHMKKKADKLHKLTGRRFWVVPKNETSLMVVDNTWLNLYNKQVPKNKRISFVDLEKIAYYCTSLGTLRARN